MPFFWQWVQLNVPHRTLKELVPDSSWRVSPQHHGFACALLLAGCKWNDSTWLRTFLEQQGDKEEWIRTRVHEINARVRFVHMQMDGLVPRSPSYKPLTTSNSATLSSDQRDFVQSCLQELAARRDAVQDLETLEDKSRLWHPKVLLGGPGSGKSYCASCLLFESVAQGFSAVVLNPTGRLTVNATRPINVRSMSLSSALSLSPSGCAMSESTSLDCDLWVVGEIGMVDVTTFNALLAVWRDRLRLPVLVCEGDFAQLPPPTPGIQQDARSSVYWSRSWCIDLKTQFRCQDVDLLAFQTYIRDTKPTNQELRAFFSGIVLDDDVNDTSLNAAWSALPDAVVLARE